jgi:tRNA (adenine37-N6)-methyltransferase
MGNNANLDAYQVSPVGYIIREIESIYIKILPEYKQALKELDTFSHAMIFWWFSEFDDDKSRQTILFEKMPFNAPPLGVFSCRSPMRPNPIGVTTVKLLKIDHKDGRIEIADIDAYNGTPVLDVKTYLPHCDRVKEVNVPDWAAGWPDWLPENGLGLENYAEK